MDKKPVVNVIGAGLAGCEAAYQLSLRGYKVNLFESKPLKRSAASNSDNFCELVCSNSLKSNEITTAGGLLKAELRILNSIVIDCADKTGVPAGGALAVDRELFSSLVTSIIKNDKNINIINETKDDFNENEYTIIATGPLTMGKLDNKISEKLYEKLYFYDAASPIVSSEDIDYSCTFSASRYENGEGDYINCPLNKDEYDLFIEELINAECAELKDFEKSEIFEGCMPIEIMAKRGSNTIRFGPLKPVGMKDPKTGKRPYAVVQLRKENIEGSMYNLVGFQTNLKFKEQKRVFSMIPALKHAEFLRYGVMHRNTYINAPKVINSHFQTIKYNKVFIAGQLSGVEGYVESIASGLIAAINMIRLIEKREMLTLPITTMAGALCNYLQTENINFQPMNANFGILPPLDNVIKDKFQRKTAMSDRALSDLKKIVI